MGCRLVRGETIYFVRHAGPTSTDVAAGWFAGAHAARLLPSLYIRSDGHAPGLPPSVVPVEIRSFEA